MTTPIGLAEKVIALLNDVELRLSLDPSNVSLLRVKEVLFRLLDDIGTMEYEGVKQEKAKSIEETIEMVRNTLYGGASSSKKEADSGKDEGYDVESAEGKE